MSICSRCGTEATPTDRFCKKCGQRFDVNDADFALAERAPAYVPPTGAPWASAAGEAADAGGSSNGLEPAAVSTPRGATSAAVATATAPTVARLLVRHVSSPSPADIHEFALDGHDIAIGRSPSCDIRLEGDQLISRRHALLRYDGERYSIVDLSSSNGTFVNDVEITEAQPLATGDRILLGEHEVVYSTEPASDAATVAGAHLRELAPARVPTPKTGPIAAALPPTDVVARPANGTALLEPELAEPTIPKSDLPTDELEAGTDLPSADGAAPAATPGDAEGAPELAPEPLTTLMPTVSASAGAGDLDAVRAQVTGLVATVEALAQRADDADHQTDQWRAALVEVRERLTALITDVQRTTSDPDDAEDLTPLLHTLRLAADNPRHVDYMMQLADSAGDILAALEQRQQQRTAPTDTLNALTTLRAWLYRLG